MANPESCEPHFASLATATGTSGEEAEKQWERISQSLNAIAARLKAWAEPMGGISKPPNMATVEEIEATLIKLYPTFRKLIKWLRDRDNKNHNWISLIGSLDKIVKGKTELEIKSSLGSYMQKRANKDKESKALIKERIEVSRMLIDLSEEIEDIFNTKKK